MMEAINWCKDVVHDIDDLFNKPNQNNELTNSRITSLFYRTLGAVLAVAATITLVSSLASFPISPISSTVGLASAAFLGAIAHDYIVMGNNIRKVTVLLDGSFMNNQGLWNQISALGRGVYNAAQAGLYEQQNNLPYQLKGTILFEPFVNFIRA